MKKTLKIDINNQVTKQEKNLIKLGVFCISAVFLIEIFAHANVSNLSLNIEKIKYNINSLEKKIESLNMKVSELTAFDNVKGAVKKAGLSYNNDNIIVIDR